MLAQKYCDAAFLKRVLHCSGFSPRQWIPSLQVLMIKHQQCQYLYWEELRTLTIYEVLKCETNKKVSMKYGNSHCSEEDMSFLRNFSYRFLTDSGGTPSGRTNGEGPFHENFQLVSWRWWRRLDGLDSGQEAKDKHFRLNAMHGLWLLATWGDDCSQLSALRESLTIIIQSPT